MTNEYSKLLEGIPYQRHFFKDADDSVGALINTYRGYQAQGYYNQAAQLLKDNIDVLARYIVTAEHFNAIDEEIVNLEELAKYKQASIYYQVDAPYGVAENDVWIGG